MYKYNIGDRFTDFYGTSDLVVGRFEYENAQSSVKLNMYAIESLNSGGHISVLNENNLDDRQNAGYAYTPASSNNFKYDIGDKFAKNREIITILHKKEVLDPILNARINTYSCEIDDTFAFPYNKDYSENDLEDLVTFYGWLYIKCAWNVVLNVTLPFASDGKTYVIKNNTPANIAIQGNETCTCPTYELCAFGCKCGYMKRDKK